MSQADGGCSTSLSAFSDRLSDTHALYTFTQPRDVARIMDNPVSQDPARITYTRDVNGFRGLDAPVDAIDIITVGGSTTDQRLVDDSATFQAVMRERFRADGVEVAIANAGIDGQSTFGHIEAFRSWFAAIDGLRAGYVLFYVGLNDILRLEADAGYDRVDADDPLLGLQLLIREKSALYDAYLVLKALYARWRHPETAAHSFARLNIADREPLVDAPLVVELAPTIARSLGPFRERIARLAAHSAIPRTLSISTIWSGSSPTPSWTSAGRRTRSAST